MYKFLVLPLLLLVAGCAALGVAPANTFNKRAVVANTAIEAAAVTVETLYKAGKITQAEAHNVHDHLVEAAAGISLARSVAEVDLTEATNRLDAIVIGLQTLDAYLRSKQ